MQNAGMQDWQIPSELRFEGKGYSFIDLSHFGAKLYELPLILRVLLENVIRNTQGVERENSVAAILKWVDARHSESEIAFQPSRVLMHDTTSTPALVDVAAMRDALAEAGLDPAILNPGLPVDVSVDHSLAVEVYGRPDAAQVNLQHEVRRNEERYKFLRWASSALKNVRIHPPGTGIMHTINLEQLATVATVEPRSGSHWVVPDTMIGTDSHTPMINGIGVLGWGVGGLEAQTVMFGMPTMIRIPDVVGVRMMGKLSPGVQATDLALTVTQRLRQVDVTGDFVEFFGPGVTTLSAGERSVVANMAPEYGATTGYFGVDDRTIEYLRQTGRGGSAVRLVEAYFRRNSLWFDPQAEPKFSRTIDIDLCSVGMHVAGPRRPQDLLDFGDTGRALEEVGFVSVGTHPDMPPHPVGIAAITSCTNTSDPRLLITAGLVARNARARGLKVPSWVKTSLAPGSPAAAAYLQRAGLSKDLAAVGFDLVGFGCSTCIGNPGPLPPSIKEAQDAGLCKAVAILSGNRNFPGRVHPDLELSFIMSPAMVVMFALAGDAQRNLRAEPVQTTPTGDRVFLSDLWPSESEIEEFLERSRARLDYPSMFRIATRNELWEALPAPSGDRFPWDEKSTALRRPPFAAVAEGTLLGHYTAHPLLVLGDDVTTDHISPASAIPPSSLVADFLVERGENRDDLNVFASRRGNWEVMLRAAFHNKTLKNLLHPGAPVAHTLHCPSGETLPLWDAAARYRDENIPVIVVAGERYGMGSSRDWAAKGQRLLGIRAVLAVSFERIHRSNLIGMGILPLQMQLHTPLTLDIRAGDRVELDVRPEKLSVRGTVDAHVVRASGQREHISAVAAVETQLELTLLHDGGVIPHILKQKLSSR